MLTNPCTHDSTDRLDASDADADCPHPETIETRLWIEEHVWLYKLLRHTTNSAPTFRLPDLMAACIALVFARPDAGQRIFDFLRTQLVLRPPQTPRRRETLWRTQYALLLELQRSPANRHPNPKFQLDQLTTACVALCRIDDESGASILHQARINLAARGSTARPPTAQSA